jgi:hypothetical protein
MKNDSLNDIQRMVIHDVMFKEGIIPMEDPKMDVRRVLEGVPEEEARKYKRKFRKMWRKAMKEQANDKPDSTKKHVVSTFTKKGASPTRSQKLQRKMAVFEDLLKNKISPVVQQFTTIKRDNEDALNK